MIEAKLVEYAVIATVVIGGALWLEHRGAEHERAKVAEATAAKGIEDARITEQRVSDQARIAHDATLRADAARVDADRSDRAASALRMQLRTFVAHARAADSAASASGSPTGDALDVLSELFSGPDDAAGVLAKALDASHNAGLQCERDYDALKP